ncbi:hypothetical protein ACVW0Q_002536 [Thermostichus sp. MS-CIW-21]|jgi:hypothetical protein|uniref:hypothetical protein n=1 Tax=unclassified Synechococcus TaxID=2626047 RepID=UPI000C640320|nr:MULTISPECIES: hypothetical protein [unclassified Synechococcus]PIK96496.1 hypothetical protein SYN60AY4M2_10455 [Synechococcus sp. 60AY4M2]PIL02460.1 hypothetical protein SYN65AY640_06215 [Synechococcus sp. 65AY640]
MLHRFCGALLDSASQGGGAPRPHSGDIALKQACDRAGLVIPYPIRTVYLFDQQDFQDHLPTSRAA